MLPFIFSSEAAPIATNIKIVYIYLLTAKLEAAYVISVFRLFFTLLAARYENAPVSPAAIELLDLLLHCHSTGTGWH
jgi:hypothetical protein